MATVCPAPLDGGSLETHERNTTRQISIDRAQDQRGTARPHKAGNTTELGLLDPLRHFGIYPTDPFEKCHQRSPPTNRVVAADDDELIRAHSRLPGGKWAQPATHVEISNR